MLRVNHKAFLLFAGLALLLLGQTAIQAQQDDLLTIYNQALPFLLDGINGSTYTRNAYASTYVIWSPWGFPVALSNSGSTSSPVVAAVQLPSSSRVVAFGHEGLVSSCCTAGDTVDRLVVNSFRWLANAKTTNREILRIAAPGFTRGWTSRALPAVAQALMANSTSPLNVTVNTSVDLNAFINGSWVNFDILCIDTYGTYTLSQIVGVLNFVNQTGKGLLVGGHIWYWGYSNPGANIFTQPSVNRILWPLGLAVTTEGQSGFQNAPTSPPLSWIYHNTFYDASQLAIARAQNRTFNDSANFPTVNLALTKFVGALPARAISSSSGLDSVWSLLDAARWPNTSVGPRNSLSSKRGYPGRVLDVLMDMNVIKSGDISNLTASSSAAFFPGAVPSTATRVNVTLTLNASYNPPPYRYGYANYPSILWLSTGLYAAPGQIINVTLETASAIQQGLQVQIGAHTDDLTSKDTWWRFPYTYNRFWLNTTITSAGNPLGGYVFILVPPGTSLGPVQVTISGAVQSPYFKLGVTNLADWANTIRSYPAPWAELDSGKFILMVPSSAARNLLDPTPLLNHWNTVMDHMAYLANMPADRARAERFLTDIDISAGWMHSGYPVMAYDDSSVYREVLNVTELQSKGSWGPYHELGHNHQWTEMQFSGTTESFVNLFTIYALEMTGVPQTAWANWNNVSPSSRAAKRATYLANGARWSLDWSVWIALDTYLQLKEGFGWEFYRRLYDTYQRMTYPLKDDNVQTWIQTSSTVAGVNLVPFYTKWGFPITNRTISLCASLPDWTANPMI